MSNNPFAPPSHSAGISPEVVGAKKVPGGIIAVSIICLILGGFNSLFGCCGIGMMAMGPQFAAMAKQDNAEKTEPDQPDPVQEERIARATSPVSIAVRMGVALAALCVVIGSIYTLAGKNWGRNLLTYSLLVAALAGGIETALMLSQGTGDVAVELQKNEQFADMPPEQKKFVEMFAYAFFYVIGGFSVLTILFYLFAWRYVGAEKHRPCFE